MSKRNKWPSAVMNNRTFIHYRDILTGLAINRFEWVNLPETVDPRALEYCLFKLGYSLFFFDQGPQAFFALPCTFTGPFNIYGIPTDRQAYSFYTNYNCKRDITNSVLIYSSYQHKPELPMVQLYAYKLYEIERAIDTNVKTQKFPALIRTNEKQRLVMENLMMQYDGNAPFIFADESLDITGLTVFNLNPPYVADKMFQLKQQVMNEFLTLLGIENSNNQKKERMISDEIGSNYGSIEANRNVGLNARRQAADEINRMFGLDISVQYRSDLPTMVNAAMNPWIDAEDTLNIDEARKITEEEEGGENE